MTKQDRLLAQDFAHKLRRAPTLPLSFRQQHELADLLERLAGKEDEDKTKK